MNDLDFGERVLLSVLAAVVGFVLWLAGANFSNDRMQQQAIDAGAAVWTIDAKTGEKSFEWVGTKPE